MLHLKSKLLISSVLLLSQQALGADALSVNAIEWCPQICSTGDKEGYVMDTVKAIFKDSPYQVEVKTYPWSRAIKSVEKGQAHALLSPTKHEAPGLLFPEQEVGIQRMCFFTKITNEWKYTGPKSLTGMKVGILQDTSIKELNSFIAANPKQFDYISHSDSYLDIGFKMIKFDRIDTFLSAYNSTKYALQKQKLSSKYKEAGCTKVAKIYMAFTPNSSKALDVVGMMNHFDSKMKVLKTSGEIKNIMKNYGLIDWQEFL